MKSFICNECGRIVIERSRKDQIQCPDCRNTMKLLDDEIAPLVIALNRKGYLTQSSCAGHVGVVGYDESAKLSFPSEEKDYVSPSTPMYENTAHITFLASTNGLNFTPDWQKVDEFDEPLDVTLQALHHLFADMNEEKKFVINLHSSDDDDYVISIYNECEKLRHVKDADPTKYATRTTIHIQVKCGNEFLSPDPYHMKNCVNRAIQKLLIYVNDHLDPAGQTDYVNWSRFPQLYDSEPHPNFGGTPKVYGINIQ